MTEDEDEKLREIEHRIVVPLIKLVGGLASELISAIRGVTAMLFVVALAITAQTCNAGCASPMGDFRSEVLDACSARAELHEAQCGQPPAAPRYLAASCPVMVAEYDRCLGPLERVMRCHASAEVYCAPWGPDVGSQCDQDEWELRACLGMVAS